MDKHVICDIFRQLEFHSKIAHFDLNELTRFFPKRSRSGKCSHKAWRAWIVSYNFCKYVLFKFSLILEISNKSSQTLFKKKETKKKPTKRQATSEPQNEQQTQQPQQQQSSSPQLVQIPSNSIQLQQVQVEGLQQVQMLDQTVRNRGKRYFSTKVASNRDMLAVYI